MGFEDDLDFNDDFETDITDLDSESAAEKPKKMNRKEFRKAKKKTAEKAADSAKPKKGLFNRRSKTDREDDDLTDDKDDYSAASPIKKGHSEFGYLFEPIKEGEDEDDVYPDSSIYSDTNAAKEMLGGLAYDGTNDGNGDSFNQYFDNPSETRPPSQFSFNKHDDDFSLPSAVNTPIGSAMPVGNPAPITLDTAPTPAASVLEDKPDSYLPDLRADSVFLNKDEREPTPVPPAPAQPAPEPPPPEPKSTGDNDGAGENYAKADEVTSGESVTQEFLPYGGMYPSYPMNTMSPMNPVVNYPIVIPNGGQTQGAYQTIPIPYPMPMPMPMYNQYPQYIPQPQYVVVPQIQPQPQVQPQPQPQPQQPPVQPYSRGDNYGIRQARRDDYDDYDDRDERDYYDDRRRSRSRRRSDSRYDDRRDYRYDDDYNDRYNERAAARYYDERRGRYERRSDRYYDRIDARSYHDGHRAERKTYPKPPYEPPYRQQTEEPEPIRPAPEPIKTDNYLPQVNPAPIIENKPVTTSLPRNNTGVLSGFDAAFDTPSDSSGFDLNSFGMNAFGSDVFDPNAPYSSDNGGFDEFSGGSFNRH